MAVQLRITSADGGVRTVNLANGASYDVKAGDKVEVVSRDGQVSKAVVEGNHVVVKTFAGETVQLKNFVKTLEGNAPAELVIPEPKQLQLRVTDDAGNVEVKTLKPGERFNAAPNQKVEVLGANLPSKYEAKGKDISFTTAAGEKFTIANVGVDGSPRPDKVSFPDLYQFGGLAAGNNNTLALQPLTLVPLGFDNANLPRFAADASANNGVRALDGGDGERSNASIADGPEVLGRVEDAPDQAPDGSPSSAPPAAAPTPVAPPAAANPPASPAPTPIQITGDEFTAPPTTAPPAPPAQPPAQPPVQPPTQVVETPPEPPTTPAPTASPPTGEQPSTDPAPAPTSSGGGTPDRTPAAPDAPVITGLTTATDTGTSSTDGKTSDNAPTAYGTAPAGLKVTIYVDGVQAGSTTAGADGAWTFTFPDSLKDGDHAITAIASSAAAGNSATSDALAITIDTTPPGIPVVTGLQAPTDTNVHGDLITSDKRPVIEGTAEAGAIVDVYVDDTLVGTTTADADGNWSLTPDQDLAEGPNDVVASARDALDNVGPDSPAKTVTLDTTAPAVAIDGLAEATDSGRYADDDLTKLAMPTLEGTAEAGATVVVTDAATDAVLGTVTADANGNWSLPLTTALPDAVHALEATATDVAGNASAAPATGSIEVDLEAPGAPGVALAAGHDTGKAGDLVTKRNQPTFEGVTDGYAEVEVYDGATLIGTDIADKDGNWSVTPATALADAVHPITAVATDVAGNTGPASAPVDLTIVTSTPMPTINPSATGPTTPITGTAGPGATITLTVGGSPVDAVPPIVADEDGNWSYTPATDDTRFDDGPRVITAKATDGAGNEAGPATATVDVNTTYPPAPHVSGITTATDTAGASDADGITAVTKPVIHGTYTNGDLAVIAVEVRLDGAKIGDATLNAGAWTLTPATDLPAGEHKITAVAKDGVNTSGLSNAAAIEIDATKPDAPTVTGLKAPTDTADPNDAITSVTKPTLVGKAEKGAVVEVFDGATSLGKATADGNGNWSLPVPTAMTAGGHDITATATDPAGNTSDKSAKKVVTIDTAAPAKPTVTGLTAETDTGVSPTDRLTKVTQPTIVGKAEKGAIVEVYDGATLLGKATANADGDWSLALTSPLAYGAHEVTAIAVDVAGNRSVPADKKAVTIDDKAPQAPSVHGLTPATDTGDDHTDAITANTKPTIVGSAEPLSTVKVYDGTTLIGTVKADDEGNWSLEAPLVHGVHPITATATDDAGNTSPASDHKNVQVSTTKPAAPVVLGLTTPTDTAGVSDSDDLTYITKPTLEGTAVPLADVFIYEGTTLVGEARSDADGKWTLPLTTALPPGEHQFHATVTDAIGNTSLPSAKKAVTVDVTAPTGATTITGIEAADSGADDFTTNDEQPTIVGTAEKGTTVTVKADGVLLGTTRVADDGSWKLVLGTGPNEVNALLVEGPNAITAFASDDAGNAGTSVASQVVTIDTGKPGEGDKAATTIGGIKADNTGDATDLTTQDKQPTIYGKAEPKTTVTVTLGATELGKVTVSDAGDWELPLGTGTYTEQLAEGPNAIKAVATDAAGNVEATGATATITVDTAKPGESSTPATTITGIKDTNSGDGADLLTNDKQPTIYGKTDPTATVKITLGATVLGEVKANDSGDWELPLGTGAFTEQLAEGPNAIVAIATDVAGNVEATGASATITVDTVEPGDGGTPATTIVGVKDTNSGDGTDLITNDKQPTIHGKAEPKATVKVTLGATTLGEVKANDSGDWELPLGTGSFTELLAEGPNAIKAVATDLAGNTETTGATATITVDTAKPGEGSTAATTITGIKDTNSGDGTDLVTSDKQPTIYGKADPKATVKVTLGTTTLGEVKANDAGDWELPLGTGAFTEQLAEGPNAIKAVATDVAGNVEATGATATITVDTTKPGENSTPATTITGIKDTNSGDGTDLITNDKQPTIYGKADPKATVKVTLGATVLGEVKANDSGDWELPLGTGTFTEQFAEGANAIKAIATDVAGNTEATGATATITVDTFKPGENSTPVTTITGIKDTNSGDGTDLITSDKQPTIYGKADPKATVKVTLGATVLGEVKANDSGDWELPLGTGSFTEQLAENANVVKAIATDVAGNTEATGATATITVDTTKPTAAVTGLTDATDTGTTGDEITTNAQPTIVGTGETGTTVAVMKGATELGKAAVVAGGWSLDLADAAVNKTLAMGDNAVTVIPTDKAGNVGDESAPLTVKIVSATVAAPVITGLTSLTDTGTSDTDELTNDTTPVLQGTATTGLTVDVYKRVGAVDTKLGEATATGGAWTFELTPAFAAGTYEFVAKARDGNGTTSVDSNVLPVEIDTTAPGAPVVGGLTTLTDTAGASTSDDVTKDNTPAIEGTTVANGSVYIYAGGTLLGVATAGADTIWTLPVTDALPDGTHTITAVAFDAAGNLSGVSNAVDVVIDAAAPDVPVVLGIRAADDTGRSNADAYTKEKQPEIYGTAEPNAVVTVKNGATTLGTATADADGAWKLDLTSDLPEAANAITAIATDKAGNASAESLPSTVTVDVTKPAAPVISGLTAATDSGSSATDAKTNVATPTLSGTAEAGAIVTVTAGASTLGTAVADSAGKWSLALTTPLTGAHTLTATATDKAGNVSDPATDKVVTFDGGAPAAPVVSGLTTATDSGDALFANSDSDDVTNDTTPTLEGTAEDGATVSVYAGQTLLGTTVATGGTWTLTPGAALAEGVHPITATATDAAGNVSAASVSKDVTIKTSTEVPTVVALVGAGATTTLSGKAGANVKVKVAIDGGAETTVTADANGDWTHTTATALAAGAHAVTLKAVDKAGNTAQDLAAKIFVASVPEAPKVAGLTTGTDSAGASNADGITNDATPDGTGTATAGTTVKVYVDGDLVGQTTAAGGTWTQALGTLAEGDHVITAVAVDGTGTPSGLSAGKTITVDLTKPAKPTIIAITNATDAGLSDTDAITAVASPVLFGAAEAKATVEIFKGATLVGTTTADADGNWKITLTGIGDGTHVLNAKATDVAGNVGDPSADFTVVVDSTAPAAPAVTGITAATDSGTSDADAYTKVKAPVLKGTAEAKALVSVFKAGVLVGKAYADASGAWVLPVTDDLADGTYAFSAKATDLAGNASPASIDANVTIDTVAPTAPTIALAAGSDTGTSATDGTTKLATPTVAGKAEADAIVKIYDGIELLGTTTADGTTGDWTFTIPGAKALVDGLHGLSATATDKAGNVSTPSAERAVTVVSGMPAPTITPGASGSTTPIKGTAAPGATVQVTIDGAGPFTVKADASGNWAYQPASPLAIGNHAVSVTASDVAGNAAGPVAGTVAVAAAPAAPVVTGLTTGTDSAGLSNTDGITKIMTPVATGTTKANTTVEVFVDGTSVGAATVSGTTWTKTLPSGLTEASHVVTAKATDAAGTSAASNAKTIVLDATAPAGPIVHGLTPHSGGGTDGNSNLTRPTVTGKAEAGATVNLYGDDDTTIIGTTVADKNGNWKLTPTQAQAPGSHDWHAKAVDAAGNESGWSADKATKIATSADAPTISLDATSKTGTSNTATNLTNPKIKIQADPGATVTVYVDGKKDGIALVADATTGVATHTIATALKGAHTITATQVTLEGNTSPSSNALGLTHKANKLHHPVAIHLTEDTDLGTSNHDRVTSDQTPKIYGKSQEPFHWVEVYHPDGTPIGDPVPTDAQGHWVIDVPFLAPGEYDFTARTLDDAGNYSRHSGHVTVKIVLDGPSEPTNIKLDPTGDSGTSATDAYTKNQLPIVRGTATAGTKVQVYVDGVADGAPETASASGTVTHQILSPLAAGARAITMQATDAVNKSSSVSAATTVTVDDATTAPTVTTSYASANPTLTGTVEANAVVKVVVDGGAEQAATVTGTTWTLATTFALGSSHTAVVTVTDKAGNTATSGSQTITVAAAASTSTIGLTAGTDTGTAGDLSTKWTAPVLTGDEDNAVNGTQVALTIDGKAVNVTTDANGVWTYQVPTSLSVGNHAVSTPTKAATLVIESGGPAIAVTNIANATVGADVVPTLTNIDGTPNLTFTVVGFTSTAGTWYLRTNNGQGHNNQPLLINGNTITETNLANGWLIYNKTALGSDTVTVTITDTVTGIVARGTLKVSDAGNAFRFVPDDPAAPTLEFPVVPDAPASLGTSVFLEAELDFGRLGQAAGQAPEAGVIGWRQAVGELVVPESRPVTLEQLALARVAGAADPAAAPTAFLRPDGEDLQAIDLLRAAVNGAGGTHPDPYANLLEQTGYQLS